MLIIVVVVVYVLVDEHWSFLLKICSFNISFKIKKLTLFHENEAIKVYLHMLHFELFQKLFLGTSIAAGKNIKMITAEL